MSEHSPEPPQTGLAQIDQALADLDLSGPVAEHPEQLAAAVEAVQAALRSNPAS